MNKNFKSNTIWVVGGAVFKAIIGFVISILTARYLGPSNYGVIGYISSITNLFSAFATLGLANILIKEYIEHKEETGEITGTAIALQFISSFVSYILIVVMVMGFNPQDKSMLICALIQGAYHLLNCFECINYYYQSKFKSKYTIIITLFAYLIVQSFKILLLILNKDMVWFSIAISLEPFVVSICLVLIYLIKKEPYFKYSKRVAKRLLKQSLPFVLAGTISVLYASIDKIMLKEVFENTIEVGYYNVGYGLSHFYVFLLSALISSFSAIIYETYKDKNEDLANLRSRQLYFLVFLIGFVGAIALSVLAPVLIPILYTKTYTNSILPTVLLSWSIPFSYIGVARNIQMVSENLQKNTVIFSCCTVILNISLNSVFIPHLGATGAAIGTLLSEVFVCLLMPLIFGKTRHIGKNTLLALTCRKIEIGFIKNNILSVLKKQKKDSIDKGESDSEKQN